jgi:hypothetical protein
VFFYFLYFLSIFIRTKWWSQSQSAPLQLLTSIILDSFLPSTNTRTISLLVLPSGDCQVSLCTFLCWKYVLIIIVLLLVTNSIALVSYSFYISCSPQLPVTGLKTSSFPIFALHLPTIIFVSCAGILWYILISLS